jgi:hypothetical protein
VGALGEPQGLPLVLWVSSPGIQTHCMAKLWSLYGLVCHDSDSASTTGHVASWVSADLMVLTSPHGHSTARL